MKIVDVKTLVAKGPYAASSEWAALRPTIQHAVRAASWPPGSGLFTIYPESGKKSGEGNGVKPLKNETIAMLTGGGPSYGALIRSGAMPKQGQWVAEVPWPVGERIRPGNMDAAYFGTNGIVCLEWETGNVSSSHRSVNKMCLGLLQGAIKAGVLVVPSRALYPYLTDRIGNIAELEPYFPMWEATPCKEGVLEIIVIEHDAVSFDVPKIPKGTDGRAKI